MPKPIKLFRHPLSGHSHRVELFLSLLNLPTELVFIDLAKGVHKSTNFIEMNTFGQVPVIDDNGLVLSDSNAILIYLAKQYDSKRHWYPKDARVAAQVQRWLSVAAGPIATGPATARLITVFGASYDSESVISRSHALLKVIEQELASRPYLAGNLPTVADVSNYTYIAHAPEGNVSLADYPKVRAWLKRIESLPGFVPMQRTVVGLQSA